MVSATRGDEALLLDVRIRSPDVAPPPPPVPDDEEEPIHEELAPLFKTGERGP